jgi:LPXTG-motif cell wall-anchored protein
MSDKVADSTLTGATAFLFGPWLDENAMTGSDNTTHTTWGTYVDDIFLAPSATLNGIGTLGSLIFFDANKDGVFTPADGDYGLENVTVAVYANPDADCEVAGGATPLLTSTTDTDGRYLFTLLPTDGGPGTRYAVVVTDTNNVVSSYTHTVGTPNMNDNSQQIPAYCVDLTNTASDIQYADFGFGPTDTTPPPAPGPNGGTTPGMGNDEGSLADTGQSPALIMTIAAALLTLGTVLLVAVRRKATR